MQSSIDTEKCVVRRNIDYSVFLYCIGSIWAGKLYWPSIFCSIRSL